MKECDNLNKEIKKKKIEISKLIEKRKEVEKKLFSGEIKFPIKIIWEEEVKLLTYWKEDPPYTTLSIHGPQLNKKEIEGNIEPISGGGLRTILGNKYYSGKSSKKAKITVKIELL